MIKSLKFAFIAFTLSLMLISCSRVNQTYHTNDSGEVFINGKKCLVSEVDIRARTLYYIECEGGNASISYPENKNQVDVIIKK